MIGSWRSAPTIFPFPTQACGNTGNRTTGGMPSVKFRVYTCVCSCTSVLRSLNRLMNCVSDDVSKHFDNQQKSSIFENNAQNLVPSPLASDAHHLLVATRMVMFYMENLFQAWCLLEQCSVSAVSRLAPCSSVAFTRKQDLLVPGSQQG